MVWLNFLAIFLISISVCAGNAPEIPQDILAKIPMLDTSGGSDQPAHDPWDRHKVLEDVAITEVDELSCTDGYKETVLKLIIGAMVKNDKITQNTLGLK